MRNKSIQRIQHTDRQTDRQTDRHTHTHTHTQCAHTHTHTDTHSTSITTCACSWQLLYRVWSNEQQELPNDFYFWHNDLVALTQLYTGAACGHIHVGFKHNNALLSFTTITPLPPTVILPLLLHVSLQNRCGVHVHY